MRLEDTPDVDMNELCALLGGDASTEDIMRARDFVVVYGRRCAELEHDRIMREGPTRTAFLEFEAYWRDVAESSQRDGQNIGYIVAKTIADATSDWAARYKGRTALTDEDNVLFTLVDEG